MKVERWALIVALAAGALLRLPQLDLRPMHTDEAVHAIKFGELLDSGVYRYDKHEYHGPTLNYFTLVPAWLFSETKLAEVTEATLRFVPVAFGLGLVVLVLLVRDIGPGPISIAALLTAVSPAMVFYSRYYIQETLLVFFAMGLIGATYKFLDGGRKVWSVVAGVFAGLMFATKETWLISAGAMGVAFVMTIALRRPPADTAYGRYTGGIVLGLLSGLFVAIVLFSSFFTHPAGVVDSVLAYQTYVARAAEESRHGQPWYYFLRMLLFWKSESGPVWSEAVIVVFALLGVVAALYEQRGSPRAGLKTFLGLYALLMLLIHSLIPYKTPWLILGALQPLILLAGLGVSAFVGWIPRRLRILGLLAVAVPVFHLGWQAYLANYKYQADPANPYVYSHPGEDVKEIGGLLKDIARGLPENFAIQVVVSGDEYWPLPWYLRTLPHVGWWNSVGEGFVATPVILASPDFEADVIQCLYDSPPPGRRALYVPLFDRAMYLRPGKEIRGYIRLDLHEKLRTKGSG